MTRDQMRDVFRREASAYLLAAAIAFPALALTSVAHFHDPFGMFQASGPAAREHISRLLAPWWGWWGTQSWRLSPEIELTNVVLFSQVQGDRWPPDYQKQAQKFRQIANACPAVIAIDIVYKFRRAQDVTLFEALTQEWSKGIDCEVAPTFIFGDVGGEDIGENLTGEIIDFAGYPCHKEPSFLILQDGRHAPCAEGEVRGFAQVWWSEEREDGSAYDGIDNREFYGLFSNARENLLRNSHAAASTSEEGEDAPVEHRPSLALAAYLAFCARVVEARANRVFLDDALTSRPGFCGDQRFLAASIRTWGRKGGGLQGSVLADREVAKNFDRPMAIQWARWSPTAAALFTAAGEEGRNDQNQTPTCIGIADQNFWSRVGESLRLLSLGLRGSDSNAGRQAAARCFPFTTFYTSLHIGTDCERFKGVAERFGLCNRQQSEEEGVKSLLRDKVVFVGFYDGSGIDRVASPAHGDLPGVYRHAAAFENLIRMGSDYLSVPRKNVLGVPGLSEALLWEMSIISIGTIFLIRIGGKQDQVRNRLLRRMRSMQRHAETLPAKLRLYFLWSKTLLPERLIQQFLLVLAMLVLLGIVNSLMGWAFQNWIRVSALSIGGFAISAYAASSRRKFIEFSEQFGSAEADETDVNGKREERMPGADRTNGNKERLIAPKGISEGKQG